LAERLAAGQVDASVPVLDGVPHGQRAVTIAVHDRLPAELPCAAGRFTGPVDLALDERNQGVLQPAEEGACRIASGFQ
jgi:hypothetical protein